MSNFLTTVICDNREVHAEVLSSDQPILRLAIYIKEILAKLSKETGGNFLTRFPPEPNRYLHIRQTKVRGARGPGSTKLWNGIIRDNIYAVLVTAFIFDLEYVLA